MDYTDYKNNRSNRIHFYFKAKKNLISTLLKTYFSSKNNSILDVGCGTGTELKELSKFGQVTAIDSNSDAIEIAKKIIPNTILADITKYDFEKKYDCVCCFDLLEHIENDQLVLNKIYQGLKKDSYFIFTVPAYQFLFSDHDAKLHHYRRYSKKEIEKKLLNANFKIVKLSHWNSLLLPLAASVRLAKNLITKIFKYDNFDPEIKTPNKIINSLFYKILNSENYLVTKNISVPAGLTIYGIAKK